MNSVDQAFFVHEMRRIFSLVDTANAFENLTESLYLLMTDIQMFIYRVNRYFTELQTLEIALEEFTRSFHELETHFQLHERNFSFAFETLSQVQTSLSSDIYILTLFTMCCFRIVRILDVDSVLEPYSILKVFIHLLNESSYAQCLVDYFSTQPHAFLNDLALIVHLIDNSM